MRSVNERNPSADRRAEVHSAEQRETVQSGLRILARMIARAHLRRQASRSLRQPRPPVQAEDVD